MSRITLRKLCLALTACVTVWAGGAIAENKKACVSEYEQAQQLRRQGHYVAAREHLVTCAQTTCPTVISHDCIQWLTEVDAAMPSVVFAARDEGGHERSDVRVSIDGVAISDQLSGRAIPLDPGQHRLRYEAPGVAPNEISVTIREGEKNRFLNLVIPGGQEAASATATGAGATTGQPGKDALAEKPAKPAGPLGVPVASWALGGAGVLALGSAAYFGFLANGDAQSMRDTCAPYCAQSDVDAARTKFTIANVSLGVAAATLGASVFFFFSHRGSKDVAFTAGPTADGAVARIGGAF